MTSPTIRPAVARDARTVHKLGREHFGAYWTSYFPQQVDLAALMHHAAARRWVFLVAERDDTVCGLVVVKPCAAYDHTELTEGVWAEALFLAVDAGTQDAGIGSALLERAQATALEVGYLGLIASLQDSIRGWYRDRGWAVADAPLAIWYVDVKTVPTRGRMAWQTGPGDGFPYWAWTSLDPDRPVLGWFLDPAAAPPEQQMRAEGARQAGYAASAARAAAGR